LIWHALAPTTSTPIADSRCAASPARPASLSFPSRLTNPIDLTRLQDDSFFAADTATVDLLQLNEKAVAATKIKDEQ
jgi:hypothetical protein